MPVLVVQMGHAGRTSGATGAPGEQAYTQAVGAECARLLARDGWTVRPIVADPSASLYRGDAFFAIHADGSTNPAVRGASVGYQTPEGAALAHAWRDAYVRRGFDGPWHPDNYTTNLGQYYGVRAAVVQGNRRACIVECGTITNAADRAIMDPTRVALAIGDALGIAGPTPPPAEVTKERTGDVIITCETADKADTNRAGILSGGQLFDITDDGGARDYAQAAINRGILAEIRVSEATWNRMSKTSLQVQIQERA